MDSLLPFLKKKDQYFLALDIGTKTVKALIFKKAGEKIIILGSSLESLELFGVFDSWSLQEDLIKKVILKTIQEARQNFASQSLGGQTQKQKIWPTFLGLSANILKSKISFQNFKRTKPKEKIQEKEKEKILKGVISCSQKEISQEIRQESGILTRDLRFLNLKILETKIDGYEVPQLPGFSGQNLEFRILNTFLLKYSLETIEKIFQDLNLKILQILSPVQNLPQVLGDKKIGGLFLDIGGEISQIILLRENKIHSIAEFPIGGEIFSQRLSETLGISLTEAEDLKIRYSKKLLTEEVRKRVKEIFYRDTQTWFNNLKLELKKTLLPQIRGLIPSVIFLCGGGSLLPEIEEILTDGDWEDLLFLRGQPKVKFLIPKDLENIEDRTKKLNSPQNIPSTLLCYAV